MESTIKVNHPEIVSIEIGEYTVQRHTLWPDAEGTAGWVLCWTQGPETTPGMPSSIPATYSSVTDAEEKLNEFRDRSPGSNYRMIRTMKIVEVVHA
jgi:hypothetical protein